MVHSYFYKILKYEELDSTSDEAKRLVRAAAGGSAKEKGLTLSELYGSVILACRQTAGRGRRGRSFSSTSSDSIYASFILEPPINPAEQLITALAAVAVCKAIENTTSYKPAIKWINDILLDGKKICGILAETVPGAVVLGIGVNINLHEEDFPEELKGIAGSLYMDSTVREAFLIEFIESVFRCTATETQHESNASFADPIAKKNRLVQSRKLMDDYRARSILPGKRIAITNGNEQRFATASYIADDGALVVEYEDGMVDTLRSSNISIRLLNYESLSV